MQAAGLLFAVVVATAIFTSRTLVRPIRRLVAGTEGITRGDASELDTERYRMIELAQLAASVSEMAASLQRRTGYVRDLARSISHEFKTPLAAMTGALEVLADHFDHMTRAERERFISNLAGDVARIESLTRRLLELAQADMRGKPVGTATVAELIRGGAVHGDDIEIRTAGDPNTVLPIDTDSLGAILRGLADNSSQHGASWLSVEVSRDGSDTVLDIVDDGSGVSAENADRIFEPFFTTRREQGGTGLGLAIIRALIANAGGTITYRSPAANSPGAAFRIRLPSP